MKKAKRSNPRIFSHPDFFEGKDTDAVVPLEQLSRNELARIPFEAFSEEELAIIEEDDPDLYEHLISGAEERRDAIIEKVSEWAREVAEREADYRTSEDASEWAVDSFQYWLAYNARLDHIIDYVNEELGEDLSDLDSDALEGILREPDLYEIKSEADANEYRQYSTLWQTFEHEASTEFDLIVNSIGADLFDLVKEFYPYLRDHESRKLLENAIENRGVYLDISPIIDEIETGSHKGYRTIDVTISIDVMHWAELNVAELQERLAEIFKKEKRIKRDEAEQDIVYKFEDGDYVADLRSDQLRTEGRMQRHCVGRPGMGYARKVDEGRIKIFSLRAPNAKAILTLEIALDSHGRPEDIRQVLGFTNRLPGFESGRSHEKVTKPDEVRKVAEFIREYLHLDPYTSKDLRPALEVVEGGLEARRANPRGLAVPARLQRLADARHARAVARME